MTDIDKLIRMNVELEGLLKVLRDRDSQEARNMLSEKIEEYTSALNSFLFAKPQEAPMTTTTVVEKVEADIDKASITAPTPAPTPVTVRSEAETTGDNTAKLLKAFTLNDRFRFRRELFAGDDEDFHETLKLLADMDSYAEACDYLYNDMMWDRNDSAVKEFMAVVAANMSL